MSLSIHVISYDVSTDVHVIYLVVFYDVFSDVHFSIHVMFYIIFLGF